MTTTTLGTPVPISTLASSVASAFSASGVTFGPSAPLNAQPPNTAQAAEVQTVIADVASLRAFGFRGSNATLASVYGTLAAAQAVYPFATALTQTIDYCAIQACHNAAVSAGAAAVVIRLPAGDAYVSTPIATGAITVSIIGGGMDATRLLMNSGGTGAWVHGTSGSPAAGALHLHDLTIADANASGSGSAGLSVQFSSGAPQPCMSVRSVAFRNWTQAVSVTNAPRGVHWENVTLYGPNFAIQSGAAVLIASAAGNSGGSFGYVFNDCMAVNYTWGWQFNIAASLEGVRFISCYAYNGWGLCQVNNTVGGGYYSLLWSFHDCDWQGLGFALDLTGCRNVNVRGGYWIANINSGSLANPNSDARRRYFSFKNCVDVTTRDLEIDVLPGQDTGLSLVYCDGSCSRVRFRDTQILSYSTIYAAFEWASNANSNVIAELDTIWTLWTGGTQVLDRGRNQVAQTLARSQFVGDVNSGGQWTLRGTTGALTSDSNGQISVTFPTRDGTNPFFIGGAPTVTFSLFNSNASIGQPSELTVTATGFTIKFSAPGITVQIVWTASGL